MAAEKSATDKVESLAADAQKAASEQFEKISRSFEDVAAFNQDNIDAMMKSSHVAMKHMEGMNSEIVSFTKKSVEDSVASAKEFTSIKSMPELMEKQSAFAKAAMDDFVKQATKFNEMYMAAARDIAEPMSARAAAAADLVKSYRA